MKQFLLKILTSLTICIWTSRSILACHLTYTILPHQEQIDVQIQVTLPENTFLYADSIRFIVDNQTYKIQRWHAQQKPTLLYDPKRHTQTKSFQHAAQFDVLIKRDAKITHNANLWCILASNMPGAPFFYTIPLENTAPSIIAEPCIPITPALSIRFNPIHFLEAYHIKVQKISTPSPWDWHLFKKKYRYTALILIFICCILSLLTLWYAHYTNNAQRKEILWRLLSRNYLIFLTLYIPQQLYSNALLMITLLICLKIAYKTEHWFDTAYACLVMLYTVIEMALYLQMFYC